MPCLSKSIRSFIGAKDYAESRRFYQTLGFEEVVIDPMMSYFKVRGGVGFFLQNYYEQKWVENSMLTLEVEDLDDCYRNLMDKALPKAFPDVWFSGVKTYSWGRELDMIDPAGVLWHFAESRAN